MRIGLQTPHDTVRFPPFVEVDKDVTNESIYDMYSFIRS